ncbi:MAG: tetratricopeptide repeat protein [bacterium]|nr:tetratricopeptide repeat protein [bacterium]
MDRTQTRRYRPSKSLPTQTLLQVLVALVLVGVLAPHGFADNCEGLESALAEASDLVDQHRFPQIVSILRPFETCSSDGDLHYALHAELGRAYFHLARYNEAYAMLREAVTSRPQHVETAIYLQACLFIGGNRDDALLIFEQLLRAGAIDLYKSVTLPGERLFLADPDVWELIEKYAQLLPISFGEGTFRGVSLGSERADVTRLLGVEASEADQPLLTARAGPKVIWAFAFDQADRLKSITIDAERLLKYTPYRLQFDHGLSWRVTVEGMTSALGAADKSEILENGDFMLNWNFSDYRLRLVFGLPLAPRPPSIPEDMQMLKVVEFSIPGSPLN